MKTIGITGGIGTGKSTVTKYLAEKGYIVIDADKMARELTEPGGRSIPYIREHFGDSYINTDGSMNRAAMRDLVFRNPDARKILEEGTTKLVIEDIDTIRDEAEKSGVGVMFFDIPLLYEKNKQEDYDEVWVVTADYQKRCERVKSRDNIDDNLIELIIGSQSEEDYKIQKADRVIYNNGTIEDLYKEIDGFLQSF